MDDVFITSGLSPEHAAALDACREAVAYADAVAALRESGRLVSLDAYRRRRPR